MTALAIVDSLPAAHAALAAHPGIALATDNPLLAADPRRPALIENLDGAVTSSETYEIGYRSVRLAIESERQWGNDPAIIELAGSPVGLAGHSTRTYASLIYRALLLARALTYLRPSAVHIFAVDAPDHEAGAPVLPSRFSSPAALLAECGFFGETPVDVTHVAAPLPASVNDTAISSIWRRALMLPTSVLLMELWLRLRRKRQDAFDFVLYGSNDAIREALPFLLIDGQKWRVAGRPPRADLAACLDLKGALQEVLVARYAAGWAEQVGSMATDFSAEQAQSLARLLARYVAAGLATAAVSREPLRQWLAEHFVGCARQGKVLVTAGLFGPAGSLLYSLAKEQRITVVTFEHGVTKGLSALAASRPEASEVRLTDWFLGCAPNAVREHRDEVEGGRLSFRAIGLPYNTKRLLWRRLQRAFARRALGLRTRKPVLMHVATWPYHGNHRSGPGVPSETSVFEIDRTLLQTVYRDLPHHVLFKPYPTQRFVHEPDYRSMFEIAPDVTFVDQQDFRYVRAAADIIVTTNPTSTLGWCLGADVPMIWLDSRWLTPLVSDELRERFRQSFLFVDIDAPDWPQRLHTLLGRDLPALTDEWCRKAAARQALLEFAITGPQGSTGRRGAAAVIEALEAA
jgi:hypothetical protein